MKIFISWSGEESKQIAEYMHKWIPERLQLVKVWGSFNDKDLPQGKDNFNRIFDAARDKDICLLILTKKSLKSSWVSFEPGIFEGRQKEILTLLCDDLDYNKLLGFPFSGYHAYPNKESMVTLFSTINQKCKAPIEDKLFKEGVANDFDKFLTYYKKVFNKDSKNSFEDNLSSLLEN